MSTLFIGKEFILRMEGWLDSQAEVYGEHHTIDRHLFSWKMRCATFKVDASSFHLDEITTSRIELTINILDKIGIFRKYVDSHEIGIKAAMLPLLNNVGRVLFNNEI